MFALPFTKASRENKKRKAVLKAAREFVYAHEDLSEYSEGNLLFADLRAAVAAKDAPKCVELLENLDPPKSFQAGREWLDILVVSISVAMAFRAYFYEPFNIPTGSMRPTLYGNYVEEAKPSDKSFMDWPLLSFAKFVVTGETFKEFRAPFGGWVGLSDRRQDGCFDLFVVKPGSSVPGNGSILSKPLVRWLTGLVAENEVDNITGVARIPAEAKEQVVANVNALRTKNAAENSGPNASQGSVYVKKGDLLWCGRVRTGDFLFVNRWLWNFRHPARGDVMIFSTTGIEGLQQGTHYIKRMTGLPGEKLTIREPKLFVNDVEATEPRRIGQISRREKFADWAAPYAGYKPSGADRYYGADKMGAEGGRRTIVHDGDSVTLGPDEYYACGDNSPNSYDSRWWGPVPAKNLRGIAGGVFWPFASPRWGTIE